MTPGVAILDVGTTSTSCRGCCVLLPLPFSASLRVLLPPHNRGVGGPAAHATAEIARLEDRWLKAVQDADIAALNQVLADDFVRPAPAAGQPVQATKGLSGRRWAKQFGRVATRSSGPQPRRDCRHAATRRSRAGRRYSESASRRLPTAPPSPDLSSWRW